MSNSAGTFASFPPASPSAGDYFRTTNSPYYAYYDGTKWNWYLQGIPVKPPPVFGTIEDPGGVITGTDQTRGLLYMRINVNSDIAGMYDPIPATPYSILAGFIANPLINNPNPLDFQAAMGLSLRSASGQYESTQAGWFTSSGGTLAINRHNSVSSYNSTPSGFGVQSYFTLGSNKIYMKVSDDGTNLSWFIGTDKNNLLPFNTPWARNAFLTGGPAFAGISMFSEAGQAEWALFDYEIS